MPFLDYIAERRIDEARARGDFDNLPGSGVPLELDDDALVPEDLRVAHRILKNAGLVPPQLEDDYFDAIAGKLERRRSRP